MHVFPLTHTAAHPFSCSLLCSSQGQSRSTSSRQAAHPYPTYPDDPTWSLPSNLPEKASAKFWTAAPNELCQGVVRAHTETLMTLGVGKTAGVGRSKFELTPTTMVSPTASSPSNSRHMMWRCHPSKPKEHRRSIPAQRVPPS